MAGERNVGTTSPRRYRPCPTARVEAFGKVFGQGRWSKMREAKRGVLRLGETFDRVETLRLPTAANDHVEIVGACLSGPQQLETREMRNAVRCPLERRDRDELLTRADHEHPQLRRAGEMRPPGMQPFPREEQGGGCTVAQQRVPLGTQCAESP